MKNLKSLSSAKYCESIGKILLKQPLSHEELNLFICTVCLLVQSILNEITLWRKLLRVRKYPLVVVKVQRRIKSYKIPDLKSDKWSPVIKWNKGLTWEFCIYCIYCKRRKRTTEKNIFAYSAKMWEKSEALHIIKFDWVNTDTGVYHGLTKWQNTRVIFLSYDLGLPPPSPNRTCYTLGLQRYKDWGGLVAVSADGRWGSGVQIRWQQTNSGPLGSNFYLFIDAMLCKVCFPNSKPHFSTLDDSICFTIAGFLQFIHTHWRESKLKFINVFVQTFVMKRET